MKIMEFLGHFESRGLTDSIFEIGGPRKPGSWSRDHHTCTFSLGEPGSQLGFLLLFQNN